MFGVDLYRRVRLACHHEGLSNREAAKRFGIDRGTVAKILTYSEPPGYRRTSPPKSPKLDPMKPFIDAILRSDMALPKKHRHTAKRIFERARDEHGYQGGITIITDYIREQKHRM